MLFNFLKRNNPPTERCKLLKENVLDVTKPELIPERLLVQWIWRRDTVRISYFPGYQQVVVFHKNERDELSKKETKWLVVQAEKVVSEIEEQRAQDLMEKLRAL